MEDTSKANIVFNISGGNNQILPNAIKAEQNFYGDKYIEETMKAKTTSQEPVLSPETTRLSLYINNVEVFRPFLVRSGQQEGLSVINPYMVDKIGFSTGGYAAKYGDKMSSALDITYIKRIFLMG